MKNMIYNQIERHSKMANKNENLSAAKNAKKDEFYTQLVDIENELRHYKEHFKDKIVFCNCDDPYESNFVKYFAMNFNALGLKKLIATCYTTSPVMYTQCSLPRKTQKTDTQNEKNAPEHHVQERFLLPINGVSPLFYLFNFSSILATCCKICLSVSLLLVSFSVSSFGLSVVVVAFFENPFSPAALMIAG